MDGRELDVYQIVNDRLIKVWTLVSDDEVFDGDIQIGDLNGDEVSEFYVGNTKGNMKKFILTKNTKYSTGTYKYCYFPFYVYAIGHFCRYFGIGRYLQF